MRSRGRSRCSVGVVCLHAGYQVLVDVSSLWDLVELSLAVFADQFADDFTMSASARTTPETADLLRPALQEVESWASDYEVLPSIDKTSALIVYLDPRETARKADPDLSLLGEPCWHHQRNGNPGGHSEPATVFCAHAPEMATKIKTRVQLLQAPSGKDWGLISEDLAQLYCAYAKPGGLYNIDIWGPFLTRSNLQPIEVGNNRASRVITGTPTGTPSSATLTDARLGPIYQEIEDRATLLWDRYRRYPEEHHLHDLTRPGPRPRLRSRGEQSYRQDWRTMARSLLLYIWILC